LFPTQKNAEKLQKNEELLVNMLISGMEYSEKSKFLFWVEDCYFNCYPNSVGIIEILEIMKSQNFINTTAISPLF